METIAGIPKYNLTEEQEKKTVQNIADRNRDFVSREAEPREDAMGNDRSNDEARAGRSPHGADPDGAVLENDIAKQA